MNELVVGLLVGFVLGILGNMIAWVISEYWARPYLGMAVDRNRSQGAHPENPPHEFYHVLVTNLPSWWPVRGRRPAWACTATIEVFGEDGRRLIDEEIHAR